MEKESDLDILLLASNLLSEHLRKKHQVVIMHPNQIAILNFFRDGPRKKSVRFLIGIPGRLIEGYFTGMVVEKRPENRI
jgi:hypothetical protein